MGGCTSQLKRPEVLQFNLNLPGFPTPSYMAKEHEVHNHGHDQKATLYYLQIRLAMEA